ncbi:hypothetical protein QR680_017551 [Steinernema hermaphroditum]|uniref:Uncharacterized protein n=1 Tax=Steinernema hermaphroditum TaxID=289476 RepID=A0AA39HHD5_9BILA|nr:hypothetical protein QR680_017551 [Steinernema hermaphroditum]
MAEQKKKKNEMDELRRLLRRLDDSNPQQMLRRQALQKRYNTLKEERAEMKRNRNERLLKMSQHQKNKLAEIRRDMAALDIKDDKQKLKRQNLKKLYRKVKGELGIPPDLPQLSPTAAVSPDVVAIETENTSSDNSSEGKSDPRQSNSKEPLAPNREDATVALEENCRKLQSAVSKRQELLGTHKKYASDCLTKINGLATGISKIKTKIERELAEVEKTTVVIRMKQELEIIELLKQVSQ